MEKVRFETNVPVELALRSTQGKPVESQYGGEQQMLSTTDGRVFYLAGIVGQVLSEQLAEQTIKPRERVEIRKRARMARAMSVKTLPAPAISANDQSTGMIPGAFAVSGQHVPRL